MNNSQALKDLARAHAREVLSASASFQQLGLEDQKALFKDIYQARYNELAQTDDGTTSRALARSRPQPEPQKASDLIDDQRHENRRIDQAGQLAGEFIDEVDFPGFVRDLLKGVFDANLEVTVAQMKSYQQLLKTATASISKFVNAIDDTAAFGYLAENNSDEFGLDFGDEADASGMPKATLTDKGGEPVDIGDNQVKAKIMEAKIAMAKEQRALLRETILMGITRLVVEKGNVKASVLFDIKAAEKINKADKAALKKAYASTHTDTSGGGLFGGLFGSGTSGSTRTRRKAEISVSSAKSQATTDLAAKVAGSVDITFKSDYFKLDNFAKMYGPVTKADKAAAGAGGGKA
jgi:hypothetical protein